MRAGYDRVYSDTLSPPIPDVPLLPTKPSTSDDNGYATAAIVAAFLFIFSIGVCVALFYKPPDTVTSAVEFAPFELPRGTH